jgi:hypothetical protein
MMLLLHHASAKSRGNYHYQLPDEPPPPEDPPPPEKLEPPELPELQELPEPPDEIMKPPMEACPLVRKSFLALVYHSVFLSISLAMGKITT